MGLNSARADQPHMRRALEHLRAARAELAAITTTTGSGAIEAAAAAGSRAEAVVGMPIPATGSLSGEVMGTGEPLVVTDATTVARAYQPMLRAGRVGPAIFVPLRVRGSATGTLMVANQKEGATFDPSTVRLVETFADQASVAIEYARAQSDLRRLQLMDERERIARELHDGVIQSLFAVGMGLQGSAQIAGPPEIAARIDLPPDAPTPEELIRELRDAPPPGL